MRKEWERKDSRDEKNRSEKSEGERRDCSRSRLFAVVETGGLARKGSK